MGQGNSEPKVLLEFAGESLVARHLALLERVGAGDVTIVTGHAAEDLHAAVAGVRCVMPVRFVYNPRYREGSVVSLAVGTAGLGAGATLVLMDGDVLYDHRMLPRLLGGTHEAVMLVDRAIDPGDEPVKICFDAHDRIVDFRKIPVHAHVRHGESVGFFRFSPAIAALLGEQARAYAADGRGHLEYEEAIRDLLLAEPERFGAVDVSDLPWTEIDFPADVARARDTILPQLEPVA